MWVDIRYGAVNGDSQRVEMHDLPRPGDIVIVGGHTKRYQVVRVTQYARPADSPQALPLPVVLVELVA